ncbi:MAG TPA: HAD-IA family hydrolase [Lachnospiraceae bacterium]|nr:HAD-IA family hydrolase [Lachnospiraceae bacterium]
MKEYRLYLFDFDYTLVNSEKGIVGCFEHVFWLNGITGIEKDDIRRTIGMPLAEEFRVLTGVEDKHMLERFRREFSEMADEIMTDRTELFPETLPMLERLKKRNARIGIVSTKQRPRIREAIDKFYLQELIDLVIGVADVTQTKPNPQGVLRAIDFFKIDKADTLYVGDSIIDAQTGMNAGIDFAAVLNGMTRREEFYEYPSVKIMDSFSELL